MKLSIYTFVKDGLYYDFHVAAMLRHHLPLADEIVVNEGHSTDGTFEAIRDIDPKIRVVRNEWDRSDPKAWHRAFKDDARRLCTGNWCILLDCDEFIPEWEFERLRACLSSTPATILSVSYVHFYANYRLVNSRPDRHGWPISKRIVHRNLDTIEVWGDGGDVRLKGTTGVEDAAVDSGISCHHFGYVRNPARLRQKWRTQVKQYRDGKWDRTPGFVFDLAPFDWFDDQFLDDIAIYDGPLIDAVVQDPAEFVRDDYRLLARLAGSPERLEALKAARQRDDSR